MALSTTMHRLHEDLNFHFEILRALGTVAYHGADVSEILQILPRLKTNDFESWYTEWRGLADRVLATIDESKESSYSPVTLRSVYFRYSHYIFVADFFNHHDRFDPRNNECYKIWRKYFDKANALLPIPGKHVTIKADGFEMPAIIYRAANATAENPRPTVIVGGGFESNMEETYHDFGVEVLDRGYNLVIYEGPGHRTLIETQQKGFIYDWEKAVSPIVDHLFDNHDKDLQFIDTSKIGLVGMSLGGYLCVRAAAFEPRLAAVMAMNGVWRFIDCVKTLFPAAVPAWEARDKEAFDAIFEGDESKWNSGLRWLHDDLKFTFAKDSGFEIYEEIEKMSLENGVAEKVSMPAWVADSTEDIFFLGQPATVAKTIGKDAKLEVFDTALGAQSHCQAGALVYSNQVMFEWFAGIVGH